MKQQELQPCISCGKGMMHAGDVTFLRVRLEHMVINLRAVQRQAGLEMAIGPLAAVMGPNPIIAERVGEAHEVLLCQSCALSNVMPFALIEKAAAADTDQAEGRDGAA